MLMPLYATPCRRCRFFDADADALLMAALLPLFRAMLMLLLMAALRRHAPCHAAAAALPC